jgi:hypothetical protein
MRRVTIAVLPIAILLAYAAGVLLAKPGRCAASPAGVASTGPRLFRLSAGADTVRDRLWLFGMPTKEPCTQRCGWLPQGRAMTILEAACYLGIPNALMVTQNDYPEPPFDDYARPLAPLKRVVWAIMGNSECTRNDLNEVIRLAGRYPNISGGIVDDFFRWEREGRALGRFTPDELHDMRQRLHSATRRLDLWIVLYAHQLDLPVEEHLAQVDAVTFWTWSANDLRNLEANFARLEKLAPNTPKLLGCYLVDYDGNRQIPLDLMKRQCRLGLQWLGQGRIAGMIFLGNPHCGLGLESAEWLRQWISEVGDRPLRPSGKPAEASQ